MTADEQKLVNSLLSFVQDTYDMRQAQKEYWKGGKRDSALRVALGKESRIDERLKKALQAGLIKEQTQPSQQKLL